MTSGFFVLGYGCEKQETSREMDGVRGDIAENNLQPSDEESSSTRQREQEVAVSVWGREGQLVAPSG